MHSYQRSLKVHGRSIFPSAGNTRHIRYDVSSQGGTGLYSSAGDSDSSFVVKDLSKVSYSKNGKLKTREKHGGDLTVHDYPNEEEELGGSLSKRLKKVKISKKVKIIGERLPRNPPKMYAPTFGDKVIYRGL
jgi:hypothetical protein